MWTSLSRGSSGYSTFFWTTSRSRSCDRTGYSRCRPATGSSSSVYWWGGYNSEWSHAVGRTRHNTRYNKATHVRASANTWATRNRDSWWAYGERISRHTSAHSRRCR